MRKVFVTLIALFAAVSLNAQVTVGIGGEVGFPLMFNSFVKGHNHASAIAGGRVSLNYAPQDANFSGSLIAGISPMILPVTRFNAGQDVLYMNFVNTSVSLLGRFRKQMNNEAELLYGIGVGANFLQGNRVQISQRSENEISRIIEDSTFYNKATLPAFYLNVEYVRPINNGSKFYYGIGAQLHYIYFLQQTATYRVDIIDKNFQYFSLQPELAGHMINQAIFVNLYYKL